MPASGLTTLDATLRAGGVLAGGALQAYRRLEVGPGARRELRDDLGTGGRRSPASRSLAYLAQLTDLQLTDVQSPGRFEFFEAFRGRPGSAALLPAQRPQEALVAHGIAAMVAELGRHLESRDTGASLQLAVSTGDNLDNAQWNELAWFLALLAGGDLCLGGGREYEGVQRADWPDDLFWKPDGTSDRFQRDFGFPSLPGLIDDALGPFAAAGFGDRLGWVSCYGNHDGLPFGEVMATPAYREIVIGGRKAVLAPLGFDPARDQEKLLSSPERLLEGPWLPVSPDESRRVVGRKEFVAAHLSAPGLPAGHGFSEANLVAGTVYAGLDVGPLVRLLLLDTANLDGYHHGTLGAAQFRWLEEQLVAVHSGHVSTDGRPTRTGNDDRLVVLASHHGLRSLTNSRQVPGGQERDQPRVAAEAVRALIHRFPNVVLWLNGHRHVNEIVVHGSPAGDGSGFVEVSTAALADWPSQARLVELVANLDGTLSVLTTMLDHGAAPDPRRVASGEERLASLHRELASNIPGAGPGSFLEGRPEDRNAEVLLRAPFRLHPPPLS